MCSEYAYGAVQLNWSNDPPSFLDRWNPFGGKIPYVIFTSHHILYHDKEREASVYNCDEFIASLEYGLYFKKTSN